MRARPDPLQALLAERLARHALADRRCADVGDAVRRTTAIQAQDTAASYLGVRARSAGPTVADVVRAVDIERSVVRTWLMRGTIHLVTTEDLRWLVRLIGPAIQRKYRTRWRQIGLTDDLLESSLTLLPDILRDGPLDRHEIVSALATHGLVLDSSDPQAPTHLIAHASAAGLVCRAADRARTSTFAVTASWVPNAPDGPDADDALAELARRYFAAYSPATAADFATWSGLAAGRAVELVRDELTVVDVDGRPGFRLGEVEPGAGVRLLPAFDNFLIGYADRSAIVDPSVRGSIYQGGMIRPVVLSDGRAAGTWRLDRTHGRVVVTPFRRLTRPEHEAVEGEVIDLGRFLARELVLETNKVRSST